jgi:hypothetical protein
MGGSRKKEKGKRKKEITHCVFRIGARGDQGKRKKERRH